MRATTRLFAVLSALAVAAGAQMSESVTVSVVEVPVTVVDGNGNPVRGLTAANFKLFDRGKEVAIASVDTIDFAARRTSSAVAPLNAAARRKFMLVFDLAFSNPASLARAQEAARAFVAKSVQPGDLVGVGTLDRRGFRLLASFTTDRAVVADAIADPHEMRTLDPLHLGRTGNSVVITLPNAQISGSGAATQHQIAIMKSAVLQNSATTRAEVESQMNALGDLAKSLREIPGRKQLVFLSEGFDPRVVQGSDAREDLTYQSTVFDAETDRRYGSNGAASTLQRMAAAFHAADVVLHAIDIQGVRNDIDVTGATINSNDALRLLAEPTGGLAFRNTNRLGSDFDRLMRAEEVVYVLAFHAPAAKAGQFHELKVKLVDVPGGATASARGGYFEAGGDAAQQERTLTNAEIVMNDVEQKDLRTAAVAVPFPASVPVVVEVNGGDLSNQRAVDFYVYAFDEQGTVRDRLYQHVTLDLAKVGARLRASGVKYWATLALPPGRYAVKTLVAAGSKRGFVRTDVVVPEANELAAAPVFVDDNPNWVLVKGTKATYPFDLFVPAATPKKRVAIFVPNANPDEVAFSAPKAHYLGTAKTDHTTALMMELDNAATIIVGRKDVPAERLVIQISPNL